VFRVTDVVGKDNQQVNAKASQRQQDQRSHFPIRGQAMFPKPSNADHREQGKREPEQEIGIRVEIRESEIASRKRFTFIKTCLTAKAGTPGGFSNFPPLIIRWKINGTMASGVRRYTWAKREKRDVRSVGTATVR